MYKRSAVAEAGFIAAQYTSQETQHSIVCLIVLLCLLIALFLHQSCLLFAARSDGTIAYRLFFLFFKFMTLV